MAADSRGDAVATWESGNPHAIEAAGYDGAGPELRSLPIPASGVAGAPLRFAVDAVDVWSGVSSIAWSFGDGSGAIGAAVSHTYGGAAQDSVALTAVDGSGNSTSASGTVNVGVAARAATAGVARARRTALVGKGSAELMLACGSARCTGLAELLARVPSRRAAAGAKHETRLVLAGKSRFDIAPTAHGVVKVKLRLRGEGVLPAP